MATRKRTEIRRGRGTGSYYGSGYIEGNAVKRLGETYGGAQRRRQAEPGREIHRKPGRRPKANPAQRTSWDLPSLLFMVAALSIAMYVCVSYLQVQHDVVTMNKTIASMESEILELKNRNDAAYNKIDTAMDLAHIYKIATEELGMVHPIKNQVFSYDNKKSSYVRQYGDIPDTER